MCWLHARCHGVDAAADPRIVSFVDGASVEFVILHGGFAVRKRKGKTELTWSRRFA
jgi:hypothetical protein